MGAEGLDERAEAVEGGVDVGLEPLEGDRLGEGERDEGDAGG